MPLKGRTIKSKTLQMYAYLHKKYLGSKFTNKIQLAAERGHVGAASCLGRPWTPAQVLDLSRYIIWSRVQDQTILIQSIKLEWLLLEPLHCGRLGAGQWRFNILIWFSIFGTPRLEGPRYSSEAMHIDEFSEALQCNGKSGGVIVEGDNKDKIGRSATAEGGDDEDDCYEINPIHFGRKLTINGSDEMVIVAEKRPVSALI